MRIRAANRFSFRRVTSNPKAALALIATAVVGSGLAAAGAHAAGTTTDTIRVAASDDAYTSSLRPNYNTGNAVRLGAGRATNGDGYVTYTKFTVGTLPAGTVVATAKLTMTADAALPGTIEAKPSTGVNWTETTLTAGNRPALGTTVATVNPAPNAATVTFDVTSAVTKAGTYAFAFTTPATSTVAWFKSVESGKGPALTLTLKPAPKPTTSTPATTPTTSPTTTPTSTPTSTPSTPATCTVDAKLVPTCGVLWGAAAGGFTTTPRDEALRQWEATSGRTSTIFHTYHRGDELFPTKSELAMAREAGKPRILFENWKVDEGTTWAKVAVGEQDARIDREAAYLKANFTEKFFLTVHHEPENEVNQTAGSGFTVQDFNAMYRHTIQRLRAQGVTNAVTVMTYMGYENWNLKSWWYEMYPGDDVVDWVALDGYSYADPKSWHYGDLTNILTRTPDAAKWPGFYKWATTAHANKPFMLGEWGVFEYSADLTSKAKIFAKVAAEVKQFPLMKAMFYFDSPKADNGGNLAIDSTPQAAAEFKKLAADPIFQVKV